MNSILIIGAGRSSGALINYVLEKARVKGWFVTVADADPALAEAKIKGKHGSKRTKKTTDKEVWWHDEARSVMNSRHKTCYETWKVINVSDFWAYRGNSGS